MGRTFLKDQDARLDYGINWSKWLREGERITESHWIVPSDLTGYDEAFSETGTVIWLSGGIVGKIYPVTNRITTSEGRTDDRTIFIKVINR